MTSFSETFRSMWRSKFRIVNILLVIYLLLLVVTLGGQLWSDGWANLDFTSASGVGFGWGLVAFIWLTVQTECDYVSDTYRLFPATNATVYLAGLATTVVAFAYLAAIRLGILGLGLIFEHRNSGLGQMIHETARHMGADEWHWAILVGLLLVALTITGWVSITLIHFLVNVASAFLPNGRNRGVKVIIAVVVIGLLTLLNKWLGALQTQFMAHQALQTSLIYLLVIAVIWAAVEIWVNIYLLRRWVEARY